MTSTIFRNDGASLPHQGIAHMILSPFLKMLKSYTKRNNFHDSRKDNIPYSAYAAGYVLLETIVIIAISKSKYFIKYHTTWHSHLMPNKKNVKHYLERIRFIKQHSHIRITFQNTVKL